MTNVLQGDKCMRPGIEGPPRRMQPQPEVARPRRMDIAGETTVIYERRTSLPLMASLPDGIRFARTSIPPLHNGLARAISKRYEQRIKERRERKNARRTSSQDAPNITREQAEAIHALRTRLRLGKIKDADYQRERNAILGRI